MTQNKPDYVPRPECERVHENLDKNVCDIKASVKTVSNRLWAIIFLLVVQLSAIAAGMVTGCLTQ